MHERIKTLLDIFIDDDMPLEPQQLVIYEKFAHTIIRECAHVAEMKWIANNEWIAVKESASKNIKQHFGVIT